MESEKVYRIKISKKGSEHVLEKTLPELIKYFNYTLSVGSSWNSKIEINPKTIKSFVKSLQKAYDEKESGCFEQTSVELMEE